MVLGRHTLLFALILGACSNKFLLPGIDGNYAKVDAVQAEQKATNNEVIVAGPNLNISPCASLRRQATQESIEFMRCNVVLSPQVNSETRLAIRSADLCFSINTLNSENRIELNGTLLNVEDMSTQQIYKNLQVRSSRIEYESLRKPSGLDFTKEQSLTGTTKQILTSFDRETKVLSYQIYEHEPALLGLVERPVDSLHTRIKCSQEKIYSASAY